MHEIKQEISEQERTVDADIEEAVTTLRRIPECDCDSDSNNVMQWFQCDKDNTSDQNNINFTKIEAADKSNDEDSKHLSHLKKENFEMER